MRALFRGLSAAASLKPEKDDRLGNVEELFRGLSAAASLKPARSRMAALNASSLPRPQCRGLIEATTGCNPSRRTVRPLFRGLSAAASLKPPATARSRRGSALFRGLSAAASLKHVDAGHRLHPVGALPRPQCRGLIEAEAAERSAA